MLNKSGTFQTVQVMKKILPDKQFGKCKASCEHITNKYIFFKYFAAP